VRKRIDEQTLSLQLLLVVFMVSRCMGWRMGCLNKLEEAWEVIDNHLLAGVYLL
jgi:hypothetical protein